MRPHLPDPTPPEAPREPVRADRDGRQAALNQGLPARAAPRRLRRYRSAGVRLRGQHPRADLGLRSLLAGGAALGGRRRLTRLSTG